MRFEPGRRRIAPYDTRLILGRHKTNKLQALNITWRYVRLTRASDCGAMQRGTQTPGLTALSFLRRSVSGISVGAWFIRLDPDYGSEDIRSVSGTSGRADRMVNSGSFEEFNPYCVGLLLFLVLVAY